MNKLKKLNSIFLAVVLLSLVILQTNCLESFAANQVQRYSYNSVKVISTGITSKYLSGNSVWAYSERQIELDKQTGLFHGVSDWTDKDLTHVNSPTVASGSIQTKLQNMIGIDEDRGSDTKNGFAIDSGRIVTFLGTNNKYAPSLTFHSPLSGTIRLYDPKGGKIGSAGVGSPYWTLSPGDRSMGIAIFQNNDKIWPKESEYFILSPSCTSITFPEIYADVSAGDVIRIELMPLSGTTWGFGTFSPQVDYHDVSEQEPRQIYNALEDISKAEKENHLYSDAAWGYSERKIIQNSETGLYEGDSNWIARDLVKVENPCVAAGADIKEKLKNMLCVDESRRADTKSGLALDGDKIITFIGSTCGYCPSLTFNAPNTGTVYLHDTNSGKIGGAGSSPPYYTLNNSTQKIGVAIFLNSEKKWPENGQYYVLTSTESSVDFPQLNIDVQSGDRIRIEFMPLENAKWGFCSLSPQIDYMQEIHEESPNFPAVKTIKRSLNCGYLDKDSVWGYSEKELEYEEGTGEFRYDGKWTGKYIPKGEWNSISLDKKGIRSDLSDIKNELTNMVYTYGDNTLYMGNGFGIYKNQVCTYIGAYNMRAPALTFNAPYTGTVKLYDLNSRTMGAALPSGVFSTLTDGEVGVAIYINENKIWPNNSDYYVLTPTENTIEFPTISNIKVNAGDQIHIAMFAREGNEQKAFCVLSPEVDYVSVDSVVNNFNASKSLSDEAAIDWDWASLTNDCWSYQEKNLVPNIVNIDGKDETVYLPDNDDWNTPDIKRSIGSSGWCSMIGSVRSQLENTMYWYWDKTINDGRGISAFNNGITMPVGLGRNGISPIASSITFTAPWSGRVRLHDPINGMIENSNIYSYTKSGEKIGVAIYKNNDKIWPKECYADGIEGLYVLTDSDIISDESVVFPDISDIQVEKGDEIHIALIPLSMKWKFMKMNPEIEYTTVNEPYWRKDTKSISISTLPKIKRYFTAEEFDFSDIIVNAVRSDGSTDKLMLNYFDTSYSYSILNPSKEPGEQKVTVSYNDGNTILDDSFKIKILDMNYGDLNADEIIDTSDLVCMKKYLVGITDGVHVCVADVNKDNIINIKDMIRLKKYLSNDLTNSEK